MQLSRHQKQLAKGVEGDSKAQRQERYMRTRDSGPLVPTPYLLVFAVPVPSPHLCMVSAAAVWHCPVASP